MAKKKGRGWWGDSAGHSRAAKKGGGKGKKGLGKGLFSSKGLTPRAKAARANRSRQTESLANKLLRRRW